jgi:membrane protease subunit HflC
MKPKVTIFIIILAAVALFLSNVFYVVPEGKQVIIIQFGEPMGEPKTQAGLYMKIPFVQQTRFFEKRILEWMGSPNEIPTRDKKFIWVDTVARWKITNALTFMRSVATESYAKSRLDDIIDNAVRDNISRYPLVEVVRNSNQIFNEDTEGDDAIQVDQNLARIKVGRDEILEDIFAQASLGADTLGIEIIDIRIRRINYIDSVRLKVFERMVSERERAAAQLRSEGQGVRAEIVGQTDKDLKLIQSEAYKTAQEIRGKADAEAAAIYAGTYGKDPEFYSFWNSLESYKNTLSGSGTVLLSTDNEYFKYLKSQKQDGGS